MPWLIVGAGLVLSATGAWVLDGKIESTTSMRFRALISVQEGQLTHRFNACVEILRGAQAFWHARQPVTQDEWNRYTEILALEKNVPGMQGLRYAPAVTASAEPVRQAAMDRARDTGEPALTGLLRLGQDAGAGGPPGFIAYLPLYRGTPVTLEERRRALGGFVYSEFLAGDFMRNALASRGLYVQYKIYDGDRARDDAELFRSEQPGPAPERPVIVVHLDLAGRPWTVVSTPGPELNVFANGKLARAAFAACVLISLLLAGLALAWARTREAAEQLAMQMTADLRERELEVERMSAQLRESNEDLQQFAYAASHDLKEPLRSIAGSLGLLAHRKTGLDERAREFLGYANDGAQRLSGLIDNLLDYSRVHSEAGAAQVVDLEEAFSTALRDLGTMISDSGAQVSHDPLPRVLGDRAQLIRVLQNLVDNAVKYSRRHAAVPTVRVSARLDGAHWILGVSDNGIGIAPEHHDKIFVMFKRLHTRQEYEGNGMGLALCKRIVHRHGGRLWLESRAGEGATFYLTLPAAETVEPA